MKQGKAAPRGPRRTDGATLEPLTIRMSTKLRFGLELLARAQHRSLSQAVEWALNVGLNNHAVSSDCSEVQETIGSIVELAWSHESVSERTLAIYRLNPVLLSFEDSKTCELIETSSERMKLYDAHLSPHDNEDGVTNEERKNREIYYRFVSLNWERLSFEATKLAQSGKPTVKLSILEVLGVQHLFDEGGVFATMNSIASCQVAKDPIGAFKAYASRLIDESPHMEPEIRTAIDLLTAPIEPSAQPH